MKRIAIATILSLAALTATAATVGGVNVAESVTVNGHTLVLNGAGIRKKLFIKVYVGSLYVPARESNAAALLAANAPFRMVMTFTTNMATKGKMADAWHEGLEDNTPAASAEVKTAFNTLASWMDDMKDGQSIVLTYIPETGTTVEVAGKVKGTLAGRAVASAILGTWLGPKPGPGADFKSAVLGK